MSDPHIQYLFCQFRDKQPLGFRPSSPCIPDMESQPLANPPPPLEEDIGVSQSLPPPSLSHVVTMVTSFHNLNKITLIDPYSAIYHYDPTYGNPLPSNTPSSSTKPPPYDPLNYPTTNV